MCLIQAVGKSLISGCVILLANRLTSLNAQFQTWMLGILHILERISSGHERTLPFSERVLRLNPVADILLILCFMSFSNGSSLFAAIFLDFVCVQMGQTESFCDELNTCVQYSTGCTIDRHSSSHGHGHCHSHIGLSISYATCASLVWIKHISRTGD